DVDLGFDTRDLVTVRVAVPDARLRPYPERLQTLRTLAEGLSEVAGISSVGLGSDSPLSMGIRAGLFPAGQPHESDPPDVGWQPVEPGYFNAVGMRLVRGRDFETFDAAGADVGILNETAARVRFPGEDPLGRQVTIGLDGHDRPITIVGIVADTRTRGPARAPGGVLFRPMAQAARAFAADAAFFAVRAPGASTTMPATIRTALARLAPGLPVYSLSRGEDLAGPYLQNTTGLLTILVVFAGTALLLGAVGVYGVAAYTVRQRRREIGVRVALGAERPRIMRDVVGGGLRRAGLGVPVGLAGAILLGRGLSSLLFQVRPTDPLAYVVVIAVVLAVTAVALWIPARLAAATDPVEVLREA
ncbi:MAG: ABC transporter permease, partial [Gemmatimonadota bacterium]